MRKQGRTITVRVSPELYLQTRHLAAEYNTTVTELVAYLLERMPRALERARFPVGGPKRTSTPTVAALSSAPTTLRALPTAPTPLTPSTTPLPPHLQKLQNIAVSL